MRWWHLWVSTLGHLHDVATANNYYSDRVYKTIRQQLDSQRLLSCLVISHLCSGWQSCSTLHIFPKKKSNIHATLSSPKLCQACTHLEVRVVDHGGFPNALVVGVLYLWPFPFPTSGHRLTGGVGCRNKSCLSRDAK